MGRSPLEAVPSGNPRVEKFAETISARVDAQGQQKEAGSRFPAPSEVGHAHLPNRFPPLYGECVPSAGDAGMGMSVSCCYGGSHSTSGLHDGRPRAHAGRPKIGRASCRGRV